jgi:hypothetical protein
MNNLKMALEIALLTWFCTGPLPSKQVPDQGIQIHGVVKDLRQKPLDGVAIRFAQAQTAVATRTRGDGSYLVQLPVRNFSASVEATGFCPQLRTISAPSALDSFTLDFTLVDCSDCDLRNIDLSDSQIDLREPAEKVPPIDLSKFKYNLEPLAGRLSTPETPIIYYGTKRTEADQIVYGGLSCPGWPQKKPTILAYRQYVLKAPTITYSPESGSISAEHDVVIFSDLGIKHFSFVKAMVVGGEFKILESK